jgi:hypothetical protein
MEPTSFMEDVWVIYCWILNPECLNVYLQDIKRTPSLADFSQENIWSH